MDTIIEQQLVMDEALVPMAQRLKIGRRNFRLLSDIKSKESTLQLVYDVLRRCPFFKAFLVTADVDILHISSRVHGQPFTEPPFEEGILTIIHFLGHSAAIRTLTDVNINKLYQPWRSFDALINKCLTGKSSGYDSFRLSQAQILWGLYHKKNIDYAYLIWEDFVYQVEHKNQKKSNEMYYPRFTKAIIHHFMSKDPSIPKRNTFGALLPIELTNDEIRNSKAYKEYYAIATGEAAPKPKAGIRRTRSSSDTSITPPTAQLAMDEALVPTAQRLKIGRSNFRLLSDIRSKESTLQLVYDVLRDPLIPRRNKVNWHYVRDDHMFFTIKLVSRHQNTQQFGALLPIELTNDAIRNSKAYKEYYAIATGEAVPKPKANVRRTRSSFDTSITPPTATVSLRLIASAKGKQTAKASKAKSLSALSEVAMTEAQQLKLVTKQSIQQTHISQPSGSGDDNEENDDDGDEEDEGDDGKEGDVDDDDDDDDGEEGDDDANQEVIRDDDKDDDEEDEGDGEDDLGLNIGEEERHDEEEEEEEEEDELYRDVNINQERGIQATLAVEDSHVTLTPVHLDVSKILLRIEQAVNEQLKAEVLTRSSHSSRTSYAVAADLSEMELKKILIKKMEEDPMQTTSQMEEPSYLEFDTSADDQPIVQSSHHPEWFPLQQKPPTLDRGWNKTLPAVYKSIQPWISELAKQADSRSSFNKLMDTPLDFSNFLMNQLRVDTLTPELLAGPTYELMKGSCKSLIELEYHLEEVYKAITDQLDWVNPECQQYPHNLL
nr:hypothetical protein [Tanacetum cinerariifolium]